MNDLDEKILKEGDPCPLCGQNLVIRHSERGDFLGCSSFPDCSFMRPIASSHSITVIMQLDVPCPKCGSILEVKKGRYGIFIGCSNYPKCNFVAERHTEENIHCPICRKGLLQKRSTKSGRIFYACNRYPNCDYTLAGRPKSETCEICGFAVKFEKKTTKGVKLVCGNPLCETRLRRKKAPTKTS